MHVLYIYVEEDTMRKSMRRYNEKKYEKIQYLEKNFKKNY